MAGINGLTASALGQAETARRLGYHFGIVSMGAFCGATEQEMIHHMRELARVMPLFGFYLLTGVGGIRLPHHFWRELVEIENIVERTVKPVSPEMRAIDCVDQLPGDPHPPTGLAHRAFEHVAHAARARPASHRRLCLCT